MPTTDSVEASGTLSGVTFHAAQLVCEADPSIGCGCRAKQVLTQLQAIPGVSQAWMHRKGHAVAIRWSRMPNADHANDVTRPVFTRGCGVVPAPTPQQCELESFPDAAFWLGALDVDELSEQEARTIAQRALARLHLSRRTATATDGLSLALAAALREVLVNPEEIRIEARFTGMLEATRRVLNGHLSAQEWEAVRTQLVDTGVLLPNNDAFPN